MQDRQYILVIINAQYPEILSLVANLNFCHGFRQRLIDWRECDYVGGKTVVAHENRPRYF